MKTLITILLILFFAALLSSCQTTKYPMTKKKSTIRPAMGNHLRSYNPYYAKKPSRYDCSKW